MGYVHPEALATTSEMRLLGPACLLHTCQPCHIILLETLFIFAGHPKKLQDTNSMFCTFATRMRTRVGAMLLQLVGRFSA